VDFYGGNFHKWFLGPEGTGFGWVNPRWKDRLQWKFGGWATDQPPAFYQGFGAGEPETCRRLFPGTIDRIPFLALPQVLAFWDTHGAGRIRAEVARKRDLAARLAEGIGWKNRSLAEPALLGPLACFERPASWTGADSVEIARRLFLEARVQLALPEVEGVKLVRLSPGVYASDDEITHAFERLASWKP
jgi:isopenicillin-N epimerase